jgi:hypothetical protein
MPNPKTDRLEPGQVRTEKKSGIVTGMNVLGEEFTVEHKAVDIERHKKATILLPEKMTLSEAGHWINTRLTEEETIVQVTERLHGFPKDCAWALQLAVQEMFGVKEMRATPGFFSYDPPAQTNVPINHRRDTETVYIGRFSVPELPAETDYDRANNWIQTDEEDSETLLVTGSMKKRCTPMFNRLMSLAKEKLMTNSLYRGKAFQVSTVVKKDRNGNPNLVVVPPEFLNVDFVPAQLCLNEATQELVADSIWTPIQRTAQIAHYQGGVVRRGALLHGAPGTGKSLTALQTAQIAQKNGWTFILVKDSRLLAGLYRLALRYAPVVLFAEDIDMLIRMGEQDAMNTFNNILDGVGSKDANIITILTTNHINVIPKVMLRPGRFDALIEYTLPNPTTAVNLVRSYLPDQIDEKNFDPKAVGEALQGNVPAVIHEVCKRATVASLRNYPADYRGALKVTTKDLLLAVNGMEQHMNLLRDQHVEMPHPIEVLGSSIGRGIGEGVAMAQMMTTPNKPNGRLRDLPANAAEQLRDAASKVVGSGS